MVPAGKAGAEGVNIKPLLPLILDIETLEVLVGVEQDGPATVKLQEYIETILVGAVAVAYTVSPKTRAGETPVSDHKPLLTVAVPIAVAFL